MQRKPLGLLGKEGLSEGSTCDISLRFQATQGCVRGFDVADATSPLYS